MYKPIIRSADVPCNMISGAFLKYYVTSATCAIELYISLVICYETALFMSSHNSFLILISKQRYIGYINKYLHNQFLGLLLYWFEDIIESFSLLTKAQNYIFQLPKCGLSNYEKLLPKNFLDKIAKSFSQKVYPFSSFTMKENEFFE